MVALQAVLIALTGFFFTFSISAAFLHVTTITAGIAWLVELVLLIRYVNKTNRDLDQFLQSVKYLDSVKRDVSSPTFRRLNLTFNGIIDAVRKDRIDGETRQNYFRAAIEHAGTGLISFDGDGVVGLVNRAALELLDLPGMQHLSAVEAVIPGFQDLLQGLRPGQLKMVTYYSNGELIKLSVRATGFVVYGEAIKLVSLQNIRSELEEGELDAWQKLIRVLTHEIMNSVTPVGTLSTSIIRIVEKAKPKGKTAIPLKAADIDNMLAGLKAIEKRSTGLVHFVEQYRRLNRIPEPVFKQIRIGDLFENVTVLMRGDLKEKGVEPERELEDENLSLSGDEKLLTQVLINLVGNSLLALPGTGGRIVLRGQTTEDQSVMIQVADNGCGIDREEIDRIFTPFYTTREEGTGIGLSLSRQIMRQHKGTIGVSSEPGKETVFTLRF